MTSPSRGSAVPLSNLPKPRLDIYRSLNALAESVIGLFKTEEIRRRRLWKGLEDVEFATLEWVAWYNGSRLLEPLGHVPPAEFERTYHDRQAPPVGMAVLT